MAEEKALFVPKGAGGYFCKVKVQRRRTGECEISFDGLMDDLAFLLGVDSKRPIRRRFDIEGVEVSLIDKNSLVFKRQEQRMNYDEVVTFLGKKTTLKRI